MGILQARILEGVAMPSSRRSFQPRDWSQVSCIAGGLFTTWATREACGCIQVFQNCDETHMTKVTISKWTIQLPLVYLHTLVYLQYAKFIMVQPHLYFQNNFLSPCSITFPVKQSLPITCSPQHLQICFLFPWIYLFWTSHINVIISYMAFYVWIFSHSILFQGSSML